MNWDRIQGNWKQLKGNIKQKWGKLTDDEFDQINGQFTSTAAAITNRNHALTLKYYSRARIARRLSPRRPIPMSAQRIDRTSTFALPRKSYHRVYPRGLARRLFARRLNATRHSRDSSRILRLGATDSPLGARRPSCRVSARSFMVRTFRVPPADIESAEGDIDL